MTAGNPGPMAPGRQLGSYTIHSLLGSGGMGEERQSSVASRRSPVGLITDDEGPTLGDYRLTTEDRGLMTTSVPCR